MRRMSPKAWSRLQPGLPLPLVIAMTGLRPLFGGDGVWPSFAACMIAGLAFVAVGLVAGPRQPMRFFNCDYLRAHLWWGAAFIVGGGLLWMLRTDALRYSGAGFAGLGVLYLMVGLVAGRALGWKGS